MQYSLSTIEVATALASVAGMLLAVAIVAWALRSRAALLGGIIGSTVGFLVPKPWECVIYRSAEAAFLGAADSYVSHVRFWSAVGVVAGAAIGLAVGRLRSVRNGRRAADEQDGSAPSNRSH